MALWFWVVAPFWGWWLIFWLVIVFASRTFWKKTFSRTILDVAVVAVAGRLLADSGIGGSKRMLIFAWSYGKLKWIRFQKFAIVSCQLIPVVGKKILNDCCRNGAQLDMCYCYDVDNMAGYTAVNDSWLQKYSPGFFKIYYARLACTWNYFDIDCSNHNWGLLKMNICDSSGHVNVDTFDLRDQSSQIYCSSQKTL